jgi:MFS family permease
LLTLLRGRNLLLLSVGYFSLNYFEYIFFYWIYYYFGEVRHMSGEDSAFYTTALLLTMMAAMPFGGWLSDRMRRRWGVHSRRAVAAGGMALSAILLCVGINAHRDLTIVFLLSLALGCAAAAEGPFWASAIDAAGADPGAASGIMNGIGNAGGMIAPVLTPFLAQRVGWNAGLYFASGVVLLGAASWVLTAGPDQDRAASG